MVPPAGLKAGGLGALKNQGVPGALVTPSAQSQVWRIPNLYRNMEYNIVLKSRDLRFQSPSIEPTTPSCACSHVHLVLKVTCICAASSQNFSNCPVCFTWPDKYMFRVTTPSLHRPPRCGTPLKHWAWPPRLLPCLRAMLLMEPSTKLAPHRWVCIPAPLELGHVH
jgi:hypothetical protein